jgi:hypothetical protein
MMENCFHVKKSGKEYQTWTRSFLGDEELDFYLEDEQTWIRAKVTRRYIDDGSGNAPGAEAHFIFTWRDDAGNWCYTLHAGIRVRMEAPTDAELIAASVWCEGGDWTGGYNGPASYEACLKHGTRYVTQHGQSVWYCDEHKPEWLAERKESEQCG